MKKGTKETIKWIVFTSALLFCLVVLSVIASLSGSFQSILVPVSNEGIKFSYAQGHDLVGILTLDSTGTYSTNNVFVTLPCKTHLNAYAILPVAQLDGLATECTSSKAVCQSNYANQFKSLYNGSKVYLDTNLGILPGQWDMYRDICVFDFSSVPVSARKISCYGGCPVDRAGENLSIIDARATLFSSQARPSTPVIQPITENDTTVTVPSQSTVQPNNDGTVTIILESGQTKVVDSSKDVITTDGNVVWTPRSSNLIWYIGIGMFIFILLLVVVILMQRR